MLTKVEDLYPSRRGMQTGIRDRLDPVVYGKSGPGAPLSAEDTAFYEKNGFLFFPAFFSADEVRAFAGEMDFMRSDDRLRHDERTVTERMSGEVRSVFEIHNISNVFARLCSDRRLAGIAEFILGNAVYIHQSRVNYKPGFRGRDFYWHSDFETWHVEDGMPRMRALSISVTLTENGEHNGPLMLVPGSHKRYVSCEGKTPRNHYRTSLQKQEFGIPDDAALRELVDDGGIVAPKGPPGSLLIFDCNVMHGSNSNITPFPRSNVFFVFNSVENRLQQPFGGMPPRPEFIAARQRIRPVRHLMVAAE